MTAPIVYKSTDGNAPVLAGNSRASFINLLTKCLVTGYGDKLGAGWTRPYANVNETMAAFRNNALAGTGFFLRVDAASTSTSNQVKLECYELMTSEGVGQFAFYQASQRAFSYDSSVTARPWVLIATDTWMYFFSYYRVTSLPTTSEVESNNYNAGLSFFFGDIDAHYADDGYACLFSYTYPDTGVNRFLHSYTGTAHPGAHALARKVTGVAGSISPNFSVAPPGAAGISGTSIAAQPIGGTGVPYNGFSGLIVAPVVVDDGEMYSIRGTLPRTLAPCHEFPLENLSTVEISGRTYIAVTWRAETLTTSAGYRHSCQLLIDITAD